MSEIKYHKGDLVKSTINTETWYGIILESYENAPKVYPVYATKYKIQWVGGKASWHFNEDLKMVCEATE